MVVQQQAVSQILEDTDCALFEHINDLEATVPLDRYLLFQRKSVILLYIPSKEKHWVMCKQCTKIMHCFALDGFANVMPRIFQNPVLKGMVESRTGPHNYRSASVLIVCGTE